MTSQQKIAFEKQLFVEHEQTWNFFPKLLDPRSPYAIMCIEGGEMSGKSWLLLRMQLYCLDEKIPVALVDFSNPLEAVTDFIGFMQLLQRRYDRPQLFVALDEAIQRYELVENREPLSVLQKLVELIKPRFPRHEDIEMLMSLLDLNYDDLPGDTAPAKLYQLLLRFLRDKRLPLLLETIALERPQVNFDWQPYLDELAAYTPAAGGVPAFRGGVLGASPLEQQVVDSFFDCLRGVIEAEGQIVLLLDAFERATIEVKQWLRQVFLPHLTDPVLGQMVIVVAGAEGVSLFQHESVQKLILPVPPEMQQLVYPIRPFEVAHVSEYISRRNLVEKDPFTATNVHWFTDGIPGKVKRRADKAEREQSGRDSKHNPFPF